MDKIKEVMELASEFSMAERNYYEALSIDVGVRDAERKASAAENALESKLRELLSAPVVPWVRVIDEAMMLAHIGGADASDDYATEKDKLNRLICWEIDVSKYHDAAAPNPPEAESDAELLQHLSGPQFSFEAMQARWAAPAQLPEPVELPEPQAEIEVRSMKTYLDLSIHEWRDMLPDGTYNIYTEQQVRALLAEQAKKEGAE